MDASSYLMQPLGFLVDFVRVGKFQTHIQFLVVASMAVDCILRTAFIDRHVRAILPPQLKVLFHYAPAVALLGARQPRPKKSLAPTAPKTML